MIKIFQISISYRGTNDINRFPFPTFAAVVRYGHMLEQYKDLLNGYTIRQMEAGGMYDGFRPTKVLKHVMWHEPSQYTLTKNNPYYQSLKTFNYELLREHYSGSH